MQLFFLPSSEHDDYLLGQLEQLRETWLETCESVGLQDELPLTVVREAWLAGLDQGRLSQRFLAGAVNFCTLMPMRAIPFKLVCLLGMNDGDYPRAQPLLDFDLMGSDYRPGDRSRREDDRYLLLEALLSARGQLYISWVGRSIRDNSDRPASVLIGQLRDHLASGWHHANSDASLIEAMTQEHPLQPFSARYFHEGDALFSYAREWQLLHETPDAMQKEEELSSHQQDEPLSLGQLQDFLRNPVKYFFSQRLKVFFEAAEVPLADEEPFVLDALQRYSLSDSLLSAALTQPDHLDQALNAQALRLQGVACCRWSVSANAYATNSSNRYPICCDAISNYSPSGPPRTPVPNRSFLSIMAFSWKAGSVVCIDAAMAGCSASPPSPTA